MTTFKVYSAIPYGFSSQLITIEGDITKGLPAFNIVGLPGRTVDESRDRIRSAIRNSLFDFPKHKIVINLAPAEVHKDTTNLDLPIALALLGLSQQLLPRDLNGNMFAGELSLNGDLRPVKGIINIIESAQKHHFKRVFIPAQNAHQAALLADKIEIIPIQNLRELWLYLKGKAHLEALSFSVKNTQKDKHKRILLDHIFGQLATKRALIIAIAGRHNLLMVGPPGTGKSLLAQAAVSLLPPLSLSEQIITTKLHALTETRTEPIAERPSRTPHHSASLAAMIGGGPQLLPGEISLAHNGILLLDEFPEFPRDRLEALRQPLENHNIRLSRLGRTTTYPANFMLIATANPCPCGNHGSSTHQCTCSVAQLQSYQRKLSGPLLDRIDLQCFVQRETQDIRSVQPDSTAEHEHAAKLIQTALGNQSERYHNAVRTNSSLSSHEITQLCHLTPPAKRLLNQYSDQYSLSARAYFKAIKVAQTIADLESSPKITLNHIAEALQYRLDSDPTS